MASRSSFSKLSKAIRPLARPIARPAVQRRTIVSALSAASRPALARPALSGAVQQIRGKKTVDFAGDKEVVYERADWPREKLLVLFSSFPSH